MINYEVSEVQTLFFCDPLFLLRFFEMCKNQTLVDLLTFVVLQK